MMTFCLCAPYAYSFMYKLGVKNKHLVLVLILDSKTNESKTRSGASKKEHCKYVIHDHLSLSHT